MTHEQQAKVIKGAVMLIAFGVAILAGVNYEFPSFGDGEEPEVKQVTEESFEKIISESHQLTVMNLMVDGNPDAEKLKQLLEQLEKDQVYGAQVSYAELEVEEVKNLDASKAIDLEKFAGQLDFYAAGKKLGSLKNETDPEVVNETIRRYLRGLIKRFGPGWLPDVEGLSKASKNSQVLNVEPADEPVPKPEPKPVATPKPPPAPGGVPSGMQRR